MIIKKERASIGIYMLTIVSILIIYNGLYTFSYFPITEGWFSEYARLIRTGEVPHRDFHLLLSAFYPLILATVQSIFGESFIVLRILGLGIIVGIAITLFFLFRSFLGNPSAAFASLSATIYYESGNAFLGYDFTQFLTLFLLLGALSTTLAITSDIVKDPSGISQRRLFLLGGFFFGCAVLTKHSNGSVATLIFALLALLIGLRIMPPRELARHFLWSMLGFLLPIAGIVMWIYIKGGLPGMIQDLFFNAASAKGGLKAIFTSWIDGFFGNGYLYWSKVGLIRLMQLVLICMLFGALFIFANIAKTLHQARWHIDWRLIYSNLKISFLRQPSGDLILSLFLALAFFACLANTFLSFHMGWHSANIIYTATSSVLILTSFNVCLVGLILITPFILNSPDRYLIRLALVMAFGLALTFGNGTSAGLSEISAFIGYGLIIGVIFRLALPWRLAILPILLFSLMISSVLMEARFSQPYGWWSVKADDVRQSVCAHPGGVFTGICTTPDQAEVLAKISKIVQTYSSEHEEIFIYPHMPVIYLMTKRKPYQGAVVSWFDFMSDKQARELAQSLGNAPPRLIIYAQLPDEVATAHERLFRAGEPSGQRKIVEAFDAIEKNGVRCRLHEKLSINGLDLVVLVPCS